MLWGGVSMIVLADMDMLRVVVHNEVEIAIRVGEVDIAVYQAVIVFVETADPIGATCIMHIGHHVFIGHRLLSLVASHVVHRPWKWAHRTW